MFSTAMPNDLKIVALLTRGEFCGWHSHRYQLPLIQWWTFNVRHSRFSQIA